MDLTDLGAVCVQVGGHKGALTGTAAHTPGLLGLVEGAFIWVYAGGLGAVLGASTPVWGRQGVGWVWSPFIFEPLNQ